MLNETRDIIRALAEKSKPRALTLESIHFAGMLRTRDAYDAKSKQIADELCECTEQQMEDVIHESKRAV